MNINAKRISIPRRVTRLSFNGLFLSIASVLRRLNRGYNDYELRGIAGEWTHEEARVEILASFANEEKNRIEAVAQSGIWHGED